MSRRYTMGEYRPLTWDGDGTPGGHYVNGHVTDDEFRSAIAAHFGSKIVVPDDVTLQHVYTRNVRVENDCMGNQQYEVRHSKNPPGSPATYWEIRPNRGSGS